MPELIVVIPVYNEAEIIETVVQDWISTLDGLAISYQVRLYNDGSTDDTRLVLDRLAAQFGAKTEVIHKANTGHGPTLLQAYQESLAADWIFQVDSDNEITASHFPSMWGKRHEFDFLIGRRTGQQNPPMRRLMSYVSRVLVRVLFGKGIHDVNSPYRLMRVSRFGPFFQAIPGDTFAPNIMISGLALRQKMRICEETVAYRSRTTGLPSLGGHVTKLLSISLRSFKELIAYAITS
ncbi:MAG: glycosyltransferase family 2 protein [Bacteroidia bacterium]|nr:glycosyltransferase family 2 protein [Bacteroidia bacterium]